MNHWRAAFALGMLCAVPSLPDDGKPAVPGDLNSLTLEQLLQVKVEGAALHPQTLADAPASVTIITAEDIRKYGYRTLGEALGSVRGFYASDNRTYTTVGARGFNLPGDYASRFLVMVNGHNMADNIFNFMLQFGDGFPIELNLIKQIEIIRGPSSALYGSNGIFATIDIITKSPDKAGPDTVTASVGSLGEKKGQVTIMAPVGPEGKLLFSGSVYNDSGESPIFIPEFNTPAANNGEAINMDGSKGYKFFSTFAWRNWTVTAVFSDRQQIQPVSWGATIFNDRGTKVEDTRNYLEAAYSRELSGGTLRWRAYYDEYQFRARFDYPLDPASPYGSRVDYNWQNDQGNWVGSQLTYRFDVAKIGTLTAGAEARFDLRALQSDQDISPVPFVYLNTNNRDRSYAAFAQDERKLSSHWTLNLGGRFDYSAYSHGFVSPRVALIYQPSSGWTYKLLYGRAFRNPSEFERFDGDGLSAVANPAARPEQADTLEIDAERKIGKRLNLLTAAYAYRLRDFLVGERAQDGLIQYQNIGRIHAMGFEAELNGRPTSWLEATASCSIQKSTDGVDKDWLENSPGHLAKLRFAIPLGRKLEASSGMQYYNSRKTLAGAAVPPVFLSDFTITSRRLLPEFDVRFGLRNAFNLTYSDPITLNPLVDTIRQPGRTLFLELIAHRRD